MFLGKLFNHGCKKGILWQKVLIVYNYCYSFLTTEKRSRPAKAGSGTGRRGSGAWGKWMGLASHTQHIPHS